MKKILFGLMFCIALATAHSYANDLGKINLRFCNDNTDVKHLSMTGTSGEPTPVCLKISNNNNTGVAIKLDFVDGTVTNDANQNKACRNPGETDLFGQYMSVPNKQFTIPASSAVIMSGELNFPGGMAGVVNGCITYSLDQEATQDGMLSINVRKANFLDILLNGTLINDIELTDFLADDTIDTKNLSNNKHIRTYLDPETNEFAIDIGVENKGNVKQEVVIDLLITNRFGYSHTITGITKHIIANSSLLITERISDLPQYGGPFTIDATVTHQPVIDFPTDGLDPADTQEKIIVEHARIFITPREIIAGVMLLLIIILALLIRKKKRKKGIAPANIGAVKKSTKQKQSTRKKTTTAKKTTKKSTKKKK